MKITSLIAAGLMAVSAPAFAQDAEGLPEADLGTIVVDGRSEREVIDDFVSDITSLHERNGQVATFDERICPAVINLPAAQAQVINDRIARAALIAGLQVGRPGCEGNVLVIFTEDSDTLVPAMMSRYGRVFRWHVSDQEEGQRLLNEFAREGRTVRWWHLTERDTLGHDGGSRLRAAYETDIYRTILVVDIKRTGPVTLAALGDYLAMTALTRMSPDADLEGLDSVLNLFTPGQTPDGRAPAQMTEWDQAYLEAVYAARGDTRSQFLARNDIAQRMQRRINQRRDGRSIR